MNWQLDRRNVFVVCLTLLLAVGAIVFAVNAEYARNHRHGGYRLGPPECVVHVVRDGR